MRQILTISIPLMLATSGHAFRLFADRAMLSHYAPEALAASMPAGLTVFCLMAFFIGTAGYASTFVSQYIGANRPLRTGPAIWQGILIAIAGGILVGLSTPFAPAIFRWMNHGEAILQQQILYYEALARLSFSGILLAAINGFWSGRGQTRIVMAIEIFTAALNIALNYVLIFGRYGFPETGITGAGLATGLSSLAGCLLAFVLLLTPANRLRFGTWPARLFDRELFARLLRFGIPNGIHFSLELVAFNLFVVFLGRYGARELEAANMAFGLNAMVFLPLIGLGMATSILVGQCVGARNIPQARIYVRQAMFLTIGYNLILGFFILFTPQALLALFVRQGDVNQAETLQLTIVFMRFIAAFLFFDGVYIVHSHAIRGAGDTRFAMYAGLTLSWLTLVLPAWFLHHNTNSVLPLWFLLVGHVMLAGGLFLWRYHQGHWTRMRVVEDPPTFEVDLHAEALP